MLCLGLNENLGELVSDEVSIANLPIKPINIRYIRAIKKSPESTNSIPNFSEIKKPIKPARRAAKPPETESYWGDLEYFNFVYTNSFFKKLISEIGRSRAR